MLELQGPMRLLLQRSREWPIQALAFSLCFCNFFPTIVLSFVLYFPTLFSFNRRSQSFSPSQSGRPIS